MNNTFLAFLSLLIYSSCCNGQKIVPTPHEYRNIVQVPKEMYENDCRNVSTELNRMVSLQSDFFYSYSSKYVDTSYTKVLVDTIVYNHKKNKMFILISVELVAKEYGKVVGDKIEILNNVRLFDGMGIMAKRNLDLSLKFKSYGYEVVNYHEHAKCKERLSSIYFTEVSAVSDKAHNIDDIRMWDESIWNNW